jgi:hypothetical protein
MKHFGFRASWEDYELHRGCLESRRETADGEVIAIDCFEGVTFESSLNLNRDDPGLSRWNGSVPFQRVAPALPIFTIELRPALCHTANATYPGSVVAFDAAGRAEVLIRGVQQLDEFVTAVRTRLERRRRRPARHPHQPPPDGPLEHAETGRTTSPPEQSNTTVTNPRPQE